MATQIQAPAALPEGLRYYMLRGSVMVPLVPVDQLPFQLQGVPRGLAHRQMSDQGWKFLCETEEAPSGLSIQAPTTILLPLPTSPTKSRFLAPDHHVRIDPQYTQAEAPKPLRRANYLPAGVASEPARPGLTAMSGSMTSLTDSFAAIYQKDAQRLGYRTPYPSGIEPDPSKKEYCTHWIKTGECAFTSIGCKFKHEMPTVDKLRELGFSQGMPKWWKEKSAPIAIRGPTWMQRRMAQGNGDEESLNELPAPRVFPDPATFRSSYASEHANAKDDKYNRRSFMRRETTPEATTQSYPKPPLALMQVVAPLVSPIPDLLIDLTDAPTPPPSPQLSDYSSFSATSADTQIPSSHTSVSLPSSPILKPEPTPVVAGKVAQKVVETKQKEKISSCPSSARRHSQIWASETDENVKPTDPSHKRKDAIRGPSRRTPGVATPMKQPGLANSKHAVSTKYSKSNDRHDRNTGRKLSQQKGNEVDIPELQAKIEQLRRDAHQKNRARKGAVATEKHAHSITVTATTARQTSG